MIRILIFHKGTYSITGQILCNFDLLITEQNAKTGDSASQNGTVEYIGNLLIRRTVLLPVLLNKIPYRLCRNRAVYYDDGHFHPHSLSRCTFISLVDRMAFDAEDCADLIRQPFLMTTDDISETR